VPTSRMLPVDAPFTYNHGSTDSTLLASYTNEGTNLE